jgi:glycosyltransferase involved in cell wall biosynthesis
MGKGLKIAYLTPHIRCDPNRTQFQRPKGLSLKNTLFIFTGKEAALPEECERELRIMRGPLKFGRLSARPLYPIWCIYKVLTLNRKFRFDLVYSTYDCYSSMSAAILKFMGLRWVADIWDHPELWKGVREKDIKRTLLVHVPRIVAFQIVKKTLKHADLVISAIHPSALTKFRISPQKTFEVTNGVDLSITKPRGLKRSDAEFRVFYVGFLMKERGLDLMLHAMAMLKERIEDLRFILVGDARREDLVYLDRTVKKLGLKDQVDFLGKLNHNDVLTLMEGSDVCLFPFPRIETVNCIYPVKIFEYMAMGKAIVATRLKGISSVIKDGVNGLLVEPGDAREMADAIFRIYENPDLRERLEANAKKVAEEYDWKVINEEINKKLAEFYQ